MKGILGSILRHVIGAAGAILAWAATADMNSVVDIASDAQAIIGALMTIGAASAGILAKIKAKRKAQASAFISAESGIAQVVTSSKDPAYKAMVNNTPFFGRSGG